jgi:hypothetical protein
MRSERPDGRLFGVALLLMSAWVGCSKSGLATDKDAAASGGSGGGSGGSGGATSSVGSVGSGGATSSVGTVGSGGTTFPGGTSGKGGVTGGAGQVGTGGKTSGATGGPTGGNASGGQAGTSSPGGAKGTGGVTGKGGATGTGGVIGTGGNGGTTGGRGGSTGTCAPPAAGANGPLVTFNDNGAWFAYQDERAVVDVKGGKLVVGSVVFSVASRSGNIEAVIYDLATGKVGSPAKLGNLAMDDHNAPAFVVRPDGKYVAVWTAHSTDCNTYYSIYDGSAWGAQAAFDWKPEGCPWDGDNTHMITYSNLWYMEGTLFDFARSAGTSPNALASSDDGATWSCFGRLTSTPSRGYVAGYYKYWGNNTDRIDFLGTEAHPRDNDNNLWHGYMQGGKVFNSTGTVIDDALAGTSESSSAQNIDRYTKVFATGSTVGQVKLDHAWNYDIVRYDDGTIAILGQGRVTNTGTDDPDKRSFYGRFDGSKWTLTYLAKMGSKLYSSEQDYTGMGALHPDDPTTIFLSTPYDPRDDTTKSSKHEIWRGTTCDNGATFQWTPVTTNSSTRNLRPVVPKWDAQHTALLWVQGDYQSASSTTSKVVGIISGP